MWTSLFLTDREVAGSFFPTLLNMDRHKYAWMRELVVIGGGVVLGFVSVYIYIWVLRFQKKRTLLSIAQSNADRLLDAKKLGNNSVPKVNDPLTIRKRRKKM
jgi:hypothetical protein